MAFCSKCGSPVEDGVKFCPNCGAAVNGGNNQNIFTDMKDRTTEFDPSDIQANKAMGILAYIGPLVLVPIFAAKGSKFARFHANQGLVLLIAEAAWGITQAVTVAILRVISWQLGSLVNGLFSLAAIAFTVAAVFGIVFAAQGKAHELPIINKIKILK